MSFGLGHGRMLDDALGVIGVSDAELPPLPDDAVTNPGAGRIDPRAWFRERGQPFEIEIGSGKGSFILENGRALPGVNFLGIEWAREFYLYSADRVRRAGLGNVRMLRTDGAEFLRWRMPDGIATVVHLYFSDPWPKKKHHKNRVVQHRFLAEVWRVLAPGGELRVVTDHDDLWEWDAEHFRVWTQGAAWREWVAAGRLQHSDTGLPPVPESLVPREPSVSGEAPFAMLPFVPPQWVGEGETVGTNYERKMCEGRPPHACVLRKP